ncbi:unnamed protein product [Zymoseptoria tritici ST99CH_3D7]|uniref:Peptidase C45 hydrolase domain-containing protein n=1 Tax=Zymoseptoria tritici (strain ST99CH_3D7) TaxID=1276538 RepID=A0A1X7S7C6_ZYMT9|nr:unnamed protein product [Zymoseptoria tritici ST99CH_3D7]
MPKMLRIECSGTPYEIGLQHGQEARVQISRSIMFYADLFLKEAKLDWYQVQSLAMKFEPVIREKWPAYMEEMRGIADGTDLGVEDIIAINVRTEIAFGAFSDGCTALSWKTEEHSWLAQNWDWNEVQKKNLVFLSIEQPGKPRIKMITEAGLIGKIGLNDAGVGVCLNAIKAKGMDATRLPCHLGLRMVLESTSRADAVERLEKFGISSACHMLIADENGGVGVEWSSTDVAKLEMNDARQVFHANHFLLQHDGVEDKKWLEDSSFRTSRIEELAEKVEGEPTYEKLYDIFCDEENFPGGICRKMEGRSQSASLFNIVMDLKARRADVTLGRPTEPEEKIILSF